MQKISQNKIVSVVGLWHLGCSVASCLAKVGYNVHAIDLDKKVVANLKKGILPVFEPGLSELVQEGQKNNQLFFSHDISEIKNSQYVVLAYDTPVDEEDKVDTSILIKMVKKMKPYLLPQSTLIVMSQVPVQTTREIYTLVNKGLKNKGIEVVYNPENLRLGNAIKTYIEADRQVLGVGSLEGERRMREFYAFFKNPLQCMSWESAELVKHGINSYMACCISFINQITDVAEMVGGNMTDIVAGMRSDSRIGNGPRINPGLGFAGATLGRDIRVLESVGKKYHIQLPLISDIYKVNRERIASVYKKIKKIYPKLSGKKIAMFGLVYKPGTSTLRRSLALEVARMLLKQKAVIHGYDPVLKKNSKETKGLEIFENPYDAVKGADILLIVTEWPEFLNLDYEMIRSSMRKPVLYDPKNMLTKETIINLGYTYYGTGI